MFWDRSQIAIVSAFDKEYILYCVNLAFGHDSKTSFVEVPEILLGTIPNDHLGSIPRISAFEHDPKAFVENFSN